MPVKAWMRVLRVTLTTKSPSQSGKNKQIVFEEDALGVGLSISVSGNKYMSTLKDNCTIKISNLTYVEIIKIITGEYYNVKIECGYKSSSVQTIFEGGVMYISNLRESVDTNTVTILCASHLIATYGQRRINLSFNSGINLYSAINFVCKVSGIPNANISTQFKKEFFDNIKATKNKNGAEWFDDEVRKKGTYIVNSDCIGNSFMTIYDANKSNARVITINEDTLLLTNGYPKMTMSGLVFSIMPTFAFQCGDVVVVKNELIQIDVQTQTDATKNMGGLLDKNNQYIIYEMHYELQNRGYNFYVEIYAKTRSKVSAWLAKG